ncbi:C2H2-type zinc finger transcription factor [Mucor lusitanicus CBS 277.49]|uniref:C2H2-type zinc finger transcription factor n=1 Tax=Mucor lusitanicus CBS 277.49 TaxID=747725 RepID=A0A168MAF3_MUCCL|nr:C2H2-type zinc finger transcription factor [Mucor lusitanicus CBS 277.49]
MKLRNRTTRVISDIKQEDCKPAPNATGESTSILASRSNSCGLIIKQEDAKDDKALLEQHGDEFGTKEYRYKCDRCNQTMPNQKSVLEHRFSIHNIKSGTSRAIKDINAIPISDDSEII